MFDSVEQAPELVDRHLDQSLRLHPQSAHIIQEALQKLFFQLKSRLERTASQN